MSKGGRKATLTKTTVVDKTVNRQTNVSLTAGKKPNQSSVAPRWTTKSTTSKMADEIGTLKKLNAELMERLKSVEEELKNTKQMCEQLQSISSTQMSQIHQPSPDPQLDNSNQQSPTPIPEPPSSARPCPVIPDGDRFPVLLICGDSMTRDFGVILKQLLPQYTVQCHTMPGATLSAVLKDLPLIAKNLNKQDIVFVLAGTNDVPHLTPKRLDSEFEKLRAVALSTNLVFSSIPYRFDSQSKHNTNIFATNFIILTRSRTYKIHYFDCNLLLSRNMYTRHGLHFNVAGKHYLCEKIARSLNSLDQISGAILLPPLGHTTSYHGDIGDKLIVRSTCPPVYVDPAVFLGDTEIPLLDITTSSHNSSSLFLDNL
uniref:SGNH hydrolase-type esterase domain-containing protein n=1 Tax=Cacopsylla melanoneura TaxID=428564 RepID=A0A8D9ASV6_9HEMI